MEQSGLILLSAFLLSAASIKDFGVIGDGEILNTDAIQKSIDKTSEDGGGIVYFPPGDYLTGTIQLRDNVTLYLEAGATIWGSKNREDYTHGCLIYAEDAVNIAIRGRGTIDGNGESFWERENNRWKIGKWRPGNTLTFVRCESLLLEDIIVRKTPGWAVHPIDCDGVIIRGISILNGIAPENRGPNTDGIDPDGCTRVRISDCYIRGNDDCIVLKITNRSGSKVCRDVTVTNCVLETTQTALKIGSETYGEFRNITFSNCAVRDGGCGVGLWMRDGGLIDGWTVDNISMTLNGGVAVYFWSWKREDDTPWGTVKNISISNVNAVADGCVFISGVEERHIEGVTLDNVRIHMRGGREKKWHENPPYPFTVWGHGVAPYDIFCRYVDDLKLRNVQVTWNTPEKPEWGSAIRCWHVNDLEIDGFVGRQALSSGQPAIQLMDANGVFVHNCRAPEGTGAFIEVGEGTEHVTLMGNDLSRAEKAFSLEKGVESKEVFQSGNRLSDD